MTLCQSIFMELARTEAKFFGQAKLPLVEIPHHPSGGARPGEHRMPDPGGKATTPCAAEGRWDAAHVPSSRRPCVVAHCA